MLAVVLPVPVWRLSTHPCCQWTCIREGDQEGEEERLGVAAAASCFWGPPAQRHPHADDDEVLGEPGVADDVRMTTRRRALAHLVAVEVLMLYPRGDRCLPPTASPTLPGGLANPRRACPAVSQSASSVSGRRPTSVEMSLRVWQRSADECRGLGTCCCRRFTTP